jgi:hypothetical protein
VIIHELFTHKTALWSTRLWLRKCNEFRQPSRRHQPQNARLKWNFLLKVGKKSPNGIGIKVKDGEMWLKLRSKAPRNKKNSRKIVFFLQLSQV